MGGVLCSWQVGDDPRFLGTLPVWQPGFRMNDEAVIVAPHGRHPVHGLRACARVLQLCVQAERAHRKATLRIRIVSGNKRQQQNPY